jgi:hypothetical protein
VINNIAGAAMYADQLADVREPFCRAILRGRERGLGRTHLVALMDLCTRVPQLSLGLGTNPGKIPVQGDAT